MEAFIMDINKQWNHFSF